MRLNGGNAFARHGAERRSQTNARQIKARIGIGKIGPQLTHSVRRQSVLGRELQRTGRNSNNGGFRARRSAPTQNAGYAEHGGKRQACMRRRSCYCCSKISAAHLSVAKHDPLLTRQSFQTNRTTRAWILSVEIPISAPSPYSKPSAKNASKRLTITETITSRKSASPCCNSR